MTEATEFLSLTLGGVALSGLVTPQELRRIEAGEVVDVVIRQVMAYHLDVPGGEVLSLGDVPCTFVGGEPTPFIPGGEES